MDQRWCDFPDKRLGGGLQINGPIELPKELAHRWINEEALIASSIIHPEGSLLHLAQPLSRNNIADRPWAERRHGSTMHERNFAATVPSTIQAIASDAVVGSERERMYNPPNKPVGEQGKQESCRLGVDHILMYEY